MKYFVILLFTLCSCLISPYANSAEDSDVDIQMYNYQPISEKQEFTLPQLMTQEYNKRKLAVQSNFISPNCVLQERYEGKLYFDNLNNVTPVFGASGGYSDVFGTSFETKAIQKFTLPQIVVLGYSFKPTNKWTINFDLEWQDWSNNEQGLVSFPDVNGTQASILSTNNPQLT